MSDESLSYALRLNPCPPQSAEALSRGLSLGLRGLFFDALESRDLLPAAAAAAAGGSGGGSSLSAAAARRSSSGRQADAGGDEEEASSEEEEQMGGERLGGSAAAGKGVSEAAGNMTLPPCFKV